jgi:hypothetical protein
MVIYQILLRIISPVYGNLISDVFCFNLELNWEKISLNNNIALRAHTCNYLPGKLYIFGGLSGFSKFSKKLYEINIKVLSD